MTHFDFRYGLIGANGSGKSSLLAVLGNREVPIQDHIDIYYLSREMPASEKSALEAVMEVSPLCGIYRILLSLYFHRNFLKSTFSIFQADAERIKLEKLAEELVHLEDEESQEYLMEVKKLKKAQKQKKKEKM